MVGQAVPSAVADIRPRPLSAGRVPVAPAAEPHAFYHPAKRGIDIVLGSILLIASLPLLALACLAIMFTARQFPLLTQRRVGRLGVEFAMFKLRTMRGPQRLPAALTAKPPHDDRVTAVGKILRRSSIDELPQLVNVLLGQMSLVGPRPGLPSEVAAYRPSWRRRLSVTPGLTGLWQVSGRSSLPARRWMALDRRYLQRRSLGFDLAILLRTVAAVVSMRGAW